MKLYADEPSAEEVRGLDDLVVSALARVEVPAGILRKRRLGELAREDAAVLLDAFEYDWLGGDGAPRFAVVAVAERVLDLAAELAAAHPLRAYDAVQLATAVAAREADGKLAAFACFDRDLAAAARAERFALVPASGRGE